MTPSNNSSNAHIFVGCGGSGIDSLTQLNLLLSQDEDWRQRLGSDVYYIVVDTDASALDKFDQDIAHQCRNAMKPFVGRVDLGKGMKGLTEPITRHFIAPFAGATKSKLKGQERLMQHWWHDRDGAPFFAPKVANLNKGAGQCPPVAYFLAWDKMDGELGDVFEELRSEVISRRSGTGAKPFESIDFKIVAGLAGGTGRGSWESIAFKLREMFRKEGAITRPNAFLFDSSVYRNVMRGDVTQKVQMEANALTGISQLSAWAHNQDIGLKPEQYHHSLPSMTTPENPAQDVLKCEMDIDNNMSGPSWKNFILFGENEVASLKDNKDYHDMTGTAMYLDLMDPAIASAESNQPHKFWSFGAASFDVPAAKIRTYFENISQLSFLENFLKSGAVPKSDIVKEMNIHSGILVPGQVPDPNFKGSFLQRALAFAAQTKSNAWDIVEGSLTDEDETPDDTASNAENQVHLSEAEAQECFTQARESIDLDFEKELRERAKNILSKTGSLKSQSQWLQGISAGLSQVIGELKAMQCGSTNNKITEIIKKTADKQFVVAGPRWNPNEKEEIHGVFMVELSSMAADKLRELLMGEYKRWQAIADRWSKSGEAMVSQAKRLVKVVENEAIKQDKNESKTLEDIHYSLFCDPDTPERGIPQLNSRSRFFRRELRPMLKYEDRATALEKPNFPKDIEALIFEHLDSGFDGSETNQNQKFRNKLSQELKEGTVVTPHHVKTKFQISKVVIDVKAAWEKHFLTLVNSADEYHMVSRSFQQFFGFKPEYDSAEEEINLGSSEDMLVSMAQSISNTCNPYWKLKISGQEVQRKTSVFIPGLDLANEKSLHEEIMSRFAQNTGAANMNFSVADSNNPFMLLAFNCAGVKGVDQIASLDYWHENSELVDVLKRAESDSGETIFETIGSNGGRGYTSPIFVNEPAMRDDRWKPWVDGKDKEASSERASAIEVLYYALLDVNHDDIESSSFQNLRREINDAGWTMPLLRESEGRKFNFTRNEIHFDETAKEVKERTTSTAWKTNDMAGVRIDRVLSAMLGNATKGESGWSAFYGEDGTDMRGGIHTESLEFFDDLIQDHFEISKDGKPIRALAEKMTQIFRERVMNPRSSEEEKVVWEELMNFANARSGNE